VFRKKVIHLFFRETFGEYPQVNMSTDCDLISTESVKNSLCSDVIMTFFCKNRNCEWDEVDQQLIDSAIKQWRKRSAACVSARGGQIEHAL